ALASVLGVGEGHLLHRETRWVGSRYFAKSESLFQSFLREKRRAMFVALVRSCFFYCASLVFGYVFPRVLIVENTGCSLRGSYREVA
ncbi:hypothetical protein, partial [Pseudomonas palmensis]|uniref:hypothetical protein n=1 Tax=Pseudomonas palmensis TaxID=2815362 RepID=UPI0039EA2124